MSPEVGRKDMEFQRLDVKNKNFYMQFKTPKLNLLPSTCHIDPNCITGLMQADGSFFIKLKTNDKNTNVYFSPLCTLTMDLNSIQVLYHVNTFFKNIGTIYKNKKKNSAELVISSNLNFENYIYPHFKMYPLYGYKANTLIGIKHILSTKNSNWHDTLEKINLCLVLNFPSKQHQKTKTYKNKKIMYEKKFNTKFINNYELLIARNKFETPPRFILTWQFIVGLIDGDGCFNIDFKADGVVKNTF